MVNYFKNLPQGIYIGFFPPCMEHIIWIPSIKNTYIQTFI